MNESQQQENLQENVEPENESSPIAELPGRRLREAREEKHLSREEVALHLRLDVQLIIALEDDQYKNLPSPAYICGYLRSYARLLKLPEKEIVEAYSHGEQINSDLIPSSVQIKPEKQINPGLVKLVIIIVILALLGGAAYYLFELYKTYSSKHVDSSKAASTSSILPVPSTNGTVTETINTKPLVKPDRKRTAKVGKASKPARKPRPIPPAELKTGIAKVEKLPTPKSTIPVSEPVSSARKSPTKTATANSAASAQTPSTGNTSQLATTTANATPASAATAPMSELRMNFTDNSWVEVTDSTNNRLVYRLVDKGTQLTLEGVPPFTILLGNAQGVQVFYKGKEFDHKNYHQNQVANFTVGGK